MNIQTLPKRKLGFTITEIMVTGAIFGMAVAGILTSHFLGLKQNEMVSSSVGASEQSRQSFNALSQHIRAAKIWEIGNVDSYNRFTSVDLGKPQQGTALRLHLTTATNTFWLYYFDTNASQLCRIHSGESGIEVIADHLTNTMYFRAENPNGDTQTNLSHKGVINASMQFCQYQYPLTKIGPSYFYNYYKLDLRITPHVPDGP